MHPLLLRTALITGLVIALVNILFAGLDYGFAALPVWFYLAQVLLLPLMLIPLRFFPQAAMTSNYVQRAGLYALGWAAPYAVYKFSSDALNPAFTPVASLSSYVIMVVIFALLFAALRRPNR